MEVYINSFHLNYHRSRRMVAIVGIIVLVVGRMVVVVGRMVVVEWLW